MPQTISNDKNCLRSRALIRLSGADVRGFMQGLVTNDVSGDLPIWAGLLTPQGKVLFDFLLWDGGGEDLKEGEDLLLDCESVAADGLIKRLSLYRLRRAITITRDPRLAVYWSAMREGIEKSKRAEGSAIESVAVTSAVADPRLADLGWRWLAAAPDGGTEDGGTEDMPEDLGYDSAGADLAWQAHRLALGVAEGQAELGQGDLLWLECNAAELHGVRFDKGCYIGQENTARMNYRAKINRRLVIVPIGEANVARQRVAYPDLGWSVEHRRLADIDIATAPPWMQTALAV